MYLLCSIPCEIHICDSCLDCVYVQEFISLVMTRELSGVFPSSGYRSGCSVPGPVGQG